jgi:3-oxoacyl-[acyl-carrier protein] reductase
MLEGCVAIVTGAGRGIGRAVASALGRHGVSVVLAARTEHEIGQAAAAIEAAGAKALAVPADVSREEDVRRLVSAATERFGGIDILVNNAAVGRFGPLEQMSTVDWDLVMAVNVRGPFMLCREAIPYLRRRERSWIVNVGSVVSVKGYVNQSAYSASKHALLGMSRALAKEVHKDGIRVHAVCPGGVDTEFVGDARPDLDRTVLMTPESIAESVVFLLTMGGNAVVDELHLRRDASTPWA